MLFEAIARPKLFTKDLFERLVSGGATLSLSLVQLLHMRSPQHASDYSTTKWGISIGLSAFFAVLEEAERLVSHCLD